MAVLDIGAVSIEQLQTVRQHTALKGAFAVYVCRKAALTAGIPATGTAAAALHAQVDKAIAQMREHLTAGSAQVGYTVRWFRWSPNPKPLYEVQVGPHSQMLLGICHTGSLHTKLDHHLQAHRGHRL